MLNHLLPHQANYPIIKHVTQKQTHIKMSKKHGGILKTQSAGPISLHTHMSKNKKKCQVFETRITFHICFLCKRII